MIWGFSFLKTYLRGPEARLHSLLAEGRTLDLAALRDTDDVVAITLGFGREFWKVESGYRIDPNRALIEGGRLIVDHGQPLTDEARLAFLRKPIEEVRWRI